MLVASLFLLQSSAATMLSRSSSFWCFAMCSFCPKTLLFQLCMRYSIHLSVTFFVLSLPDYLPRGNTHILHSIKTFFSSFTIAMVVFLEAVMFYICFLLPVLVLLISPVENISQKYIFTQAPTLPTIFRFTAEPTELVWSAQIANMRTFRVYLRGALLALNCNGQYLC